MKFLGKLKTELYRRPKDEFRKLFAWGPRGYFNEVKWKSEMEEAAKRLPRLPAAEKRDVREIHFLCGRKHWYQAAFCAWTYQRHSRFRIRPVLIDDGTIDAETVALLQSVFPDARVKYKESCDKVFDQTFPPARYPNLHALRSRQKLFMKLTDVFGIDDEWRLLFDADMLFFAMPEEIDNVLQNPAGVLVQRDCWEAYGHSRKLAERLAGNTLPQAINIGMLLFNGRLTDWDLVEQWLGVLEDREGRPYNITQCIAAMILAGGEVRFLDRYKYCVLPKCPRRLETGRVAEHYVADSKPWYFGTAWHLALLGGRCSSQISASDGGQLHSRFSVAGALLYYSFHRPVGLLKRSVREGGPLEQWKTERGRKAMEQAAHALRVPAVSKKLPVGGKEERRDQVASSGLLVKGGEDSSYATRDSLQDTCERLVEVQVLTGRKFWYQTAFCLWSFAKASGREVCAVIHDDGSLDQKQAEVLLRLFPGSRVETRDMIMARLDSLLPESKFPSLRGRRLELPLVKKITDIHLGREGWGLFFDSDLLFFHRPDQLLSWWDNPSLALTCVDAAYAYGYSMDLLNEVAGKPVYDFINTGLLGLRSDTIDWDRMEYWCRTLIERAGTSYYQEQALVALQLAGVDRVVLPKEDYLVYPRGEEASACRAAMHHYVDLSKKAYFRHNWRRVLAQT